MSTEGVHLEITEEAKRKIAHLATQINREVENIGARRLHTIMERLMEVRARHRAYPWCSVLGCSLCFSDRGRSRIRYRLPLTTFAISGAFFLR